MKRVLVEEDTIGGTRGGRTFKTPLKKRGRVDSDDKSSRKISTASKNSKR